MAQSSGSLRNKALGDYVGLLERKQHLCRGCGPWADTQSERSKAEQTKSKQKQTNPWPFYRFVTITALERFSQHDLQMECGDISERRVRSRECGNGKPATVTLGRVVNAK